MPELRLALLDGGEGILSGSELDRFEKRFNGRLLRSGDGGYDEARTVWNGMIDKRPGLIARCEDTRDVVACVNLAREHGLLVSVRGGGHNYAGKAVCEGGLMIDLSPMKGVSVDPRERTARAQAGLRLGELDRATQEFGLATTLGVNADTGIAGLTLGGGYGWLAGKHGLTCDNLIAAEVVTADGSVLEASAERNEDLFWGLRGAGANFGVVTSFQYRLHPVDAVLGGLIIYPLEEGIVRFYDQFSRSAPDELTTVGTVLTAPDGNAGFGIVACYCGAPDDGEAVVRPLRTYSEPVADLVEPRSYLEMQGLLDEVWPPGRRYYNKAHNVRSLDDGVTHLIVEYGNALPTPVSNIALQQLHGAAARIDESGTAFPHRYDHYDLLVHPATDDPGEDEKIVEWARECWNEFTPFVERAVYVNALEDALEEGEARVREAYGRNYERLAALKGTYDPLNLFRLNANIVPSAEGGETGTAGESP